MKIKKLFTSILAVALLFALVTPAFAATYSFDTDGWWCFPGESTYVQATIVTGGASQRKVQNVKRVEPNSMDVHMDKLDLNNQSNFLFRGYEGNTACTYARKITKTGYNGANYLWPITGSQYCDMAMSIASGSQSDKVYFVGRWAI